jgi:glutamate N-acetyltransferase/amino-acid N-acetyltransferase
VNRNTAGLSTAGVAPTAHSGTPAPERHKGVTGPKGFKAAGVAAGIKESGALDLALVVNEGPGQAAAGVFTTNQVKAAPVLWTQQVIKERKLHAVVLNSGGANACTGPEGFQDTHATAEKVAEVLDVGAIEVAVCSTGLIGERLPMDNLKAGVEKAVQELDATDQAGLNAATAVMTTDTHPKQSWASHPDGWSAGGFVKGAGMLNPNMATMLSVITTDAVIDGDALDAALRAVTAKTYDRIDVDGGTSTNDTVLVLASGASGVTPTADEFAEVLTAVAKDLVRQLQQDAEGVTKEVSITVNGALTEAEAVVVAKTVAEDNLVKTALFGSDPNWGRIAMAVGRAPATVDQHELGITINGVTLFEHGHKAADRSEADLSGRDIDIVIDLNVGDGTATVLTTDLSHAYVEENSAYSS